jgi:hypothetical protein
MRHTGGLAFGAISTKSNSASNACFCASRIPTTPACLPSASISLILGAVIELFKRVRFSAAMDYSSV